MKYIFYPCVFISITIVTNAKNSSDDNQLDYRAVAVREPISYHIMFDLSLPLEYTREKDELIEIATCNFNLALFTTAFWFFEKGDNWR